MDAWTQAGFTVDPDDICRVGDIRIRLKGPDRRPGIVGWSIRGLPPASAVDTIDGIPATRSTAPPATPATHASGVTAVDHIVVVSPHLGRTVAALAAIGVSPRRERHTAIAGQPMRQIFFRFGAVIIELVGSPDATGAGPASLWGLTFVVDDIDTTASFFGDRTSPIKAAVQPGRRITTLRHQEFGMSVRTAMISAGR